eukprot:scaffold33755_cov153-Skeletonema_marinoi.AAC.1
MKRSPIHSPSLYFLHHTVLTKSSHKIMTIITGTPGWSMLTTAVIFGQLVAANAAAEASPSG